MKTVDLSTDQGREYDSLTWEKCRLSEDTPSHIIIYLHRDIDQELNKEKRKTKTKERELIKRSGKHKLGSKVVVSR